MYGYIRNTGTACIVASGFNIITGFLLYLYISGLDIPFGAYFSASIYILTTSAILLIASIILRKLANTLEFDFNDRVKRTQELKNRIKELETTKF